MGGLGAAIIVALLGVALVVGLGVQVPFTTEREVALLDLSSPRTRPVLARLRPQHLRARAKRAPSPPNLKATATEIVTPPPVLVAPPPVLAARVAATGSALASGASTLAGPGEGAGGRGNGTGGGGNDDDGDGSIPPRLIKGRLNFADVPQHMRDAGIGGTVAVRYSVGIDGRASDCVATASSGNATLDGLTCDLIQRRFRFEPSRDADGRPVRSIIVEHHSWINDRDAHQP